VIFLRARRCGKEAGEERRESLLVLLWSSFISEIATYGHSQPAATLSAPRVV